MITLLTVMLMMIVLIMLVTIPMLLTIVSGQVSGDLGPLMELLSQES